MGAATVTTREAFVYSSTVVTAPPTITSVTPSCAVPGNTVTVTGTNFDVAPGATRVELGNVIAPTTVASPTSLSAVVPLGATSNTRVVTPLGISPTRRSCSFRLLVHVLTTKHRYGRYWMAQPAPSTSLPPARKRCCCSRAMRAALSLQFANFAPSVAGTALNYAVYNTANVSISTGTVATTFASIHMPLLPTTGMYAVVFAWNNVSVTGSAAVQLRSNALLSNSGAPLVQITGGPGQTARLVVTGVAGPGLGTGSLRTDAVHRWAVCVVPSAAFGWKQCRERSLLPHRTRLLDHMARDDGGYAYGSADAVSERRDGQRDAEVVGLESGHGSADTRHRSHLYEHRAGPGSATHLHWHRGSAARAGAVELYDFGKRRHAKCSGAQARRHAADQHRIYSGQYDTYCGWIGSADIANQWCLHGAGVSVYEARHHLQWPSVDYSRCDRDAGYQRHTDSNQSGAAGATGAGDIYWSSRTGLGTGSFRTNAVHRWAVCVVPSVAFGWKQCLLRSLLPYRHGMLDHMARDDGGYAYGSADAVSERRDGQRDAEVVGLSRVTGALTLGTAATYTSTVPGQAVQRTFTGTAGQQLGLALSNFTTSVSGATLNAVVLKPDGTQLTSIGFTAANTTPTAVGLDLPTLPTSGVYTVLVYPYTKHATTFSGQVLTTQDVTATLATNGTPTVINLAQPGQQARVTFTEVVGQDWALDLSALTLYGGQYVSYQVLRSDGVSVFSGVCDSELFDTVAGHDSRRAYHRVNAIAQRRDGQRDTKSWA